LLTEAGYVFEVEPADLDESDLPARLSPADVARFLAQSKAMAIAARHANAAEGVVVLGADTVVAVGPVMYGKAESTDEARAMLTALGGCRQEVLTGVSICRMNQPPMTIVERSVVVMRAMTDAELAAYLAGDQWRGKAGAYGIQDHEPASDPFVRLVEGEITNVVGLPMNRVRRMLADVGINGMGTPACD
jgi:septum formation protein